MTSFSTTVTAFSYFILAPHLSNLNDRVSAKEWLAIVDSYNKISNLNAKYKNYLDNFSMFQSSRRWYIISAPCQFPVAFLHDAIIKNFWQKTNTIIGNRSLTIIYLITGIKQFSFLPSKSFKNLIKTEYLMMIMLLLKRQFRNVNKSWQEKE